MYTAKTSVERRTRNSEGGSRNDGMEDNNNNDDVLLMGADGRIVAGLPFGVLEADPLDLLGREVEASGHGVEHVTLGGGIRAEEEFQGDVLEVLQIDALPRLVPLQPADLLVEVTLLLRHLVLHRHGRHLQLPDGPFQLVLGPSQVLDLHFLPGQLLHTARKN